MDNRNLDDLTIEEIIEKFKKDVRAELANFKYELLDIIEDDLRIHRIEGKHSKRNFRRKK